MHQNENAPPNKVTYANRRRNYDVNCIKNKILLNQRCDVSYIKLSILDSKYDFLIFGMKYFRKV